MTEREYNEQEKRRMAAQIKFLGKRSVWGVASTPLSPSEASFNRVPSTPTSPSPTSLYRVPSTPTSPSPTSLFETMTPREAMPAYQAAAIIMQAMENGAHTPAYIAGTIAQARAAIAQGECFGKFSATEFLAALELVETIMVLPAQAIARALHTKKS